VIARDLRITGDLEATGEVRIEGKISGNVRANCLKLGASGIVEGDVLAPGRPEAAQVFVIRGRVDGSVEASQVEVKKGGSVLGGILADQATIHGKVRGGLVVRERLMLEDTAEVEGDVHARKLGLKEGGQVNGNIHMGDRAVIPTRSEAAEAAPKTEMRAEAVRAPALAGAARAG
jgi:cytoskeletal protein CcmA (bactofilin family)